MVHNNFRIIYTCSVVFVPYINHDSWKAFNFKSENSILCCQISRVKFYSLLKQYEFVSFKASGIKIMYFIFSEYCIMWQEPDLFTGKYFTKNRVVFYCMFEEKVNRGNYWNTCSTRVIFLVHCISPYYMEFEVVANNIWDIGQSRKCYKG